MKVYLDLIFLINFCYDYLLLITVDITLKRNSLFYKHFISAFIGSISLITLFLPFNNYILFILKIFTSIIMIIISFGYKNIKYFGTNFLYLYMCSFILGGFLYILNNEFSYERKGLIFINKGLSINYVLLIIISPIILYLYIKEHKIYKSTISYSYQVSIVFLNDKVLTCNGFIDTGNKLKDPITKKYVILLSKKILVPYINIRCPIYVPYKSIKGNGLVECYKIKYLKINNQIFDNYLVGGIDDIKINGSSCLLNYKLMEDICLEK